MKFRVFVFKTVRIISNSLKNADLFKQQIALTYKGHTSFSTLLGGIVSMCILTSISIYTIILFISMINRHNSNNSLSTEVVNFISNDEDYYPTY